MPRLTALSAGLAVTVVLAFICVRHYAVVIPEDIETRLIARLTENNVSVSPSEDTNAPVVSATIDGRDVTLTGIVKNEAEKTRILSVTQTVYGIRLIKDRISVVKPAPKEKKTSIATMTRDPAPEKERREKPNPTPKKATISCAETVRLIIGDKSVRFPPESAVLSAKDKALLNALSEALQSCADTVITVIGHSDTSGSDALNNRLSLLRAQAAAAALRDAGLDENRIKTKNAGSSHPIADNADPEGRAKNRRIEFHLKTALTAP